MICNAHTRTPKLNPPKNPSLTQATKNPDNHLPPKPTHSKTNPRTQPTQTPTSIHQQPKRTIELPHQTIQTHAHTQAHSLNPPTRNLTTHKNLSYVFFFF